MRAAAKSGDMVTELVTKVAVFRCDFAFVTMSPVSPGEKQPLSKCVCVIATASPIEKHHTRDLLRRLKTTGDTGDTGDNRGKRSVLLSYSVTTFLSETGDLR